MIMEVAGVCAGTEVSVLVKVILSASYVVYNFRQNKSISIVKT